MLAAPIALLVGYTPRFIALVAALAGTYTFNIYASLTGRPLDVLSHTWTLAQEEQFYLVAPPLLAILVQRGIAGSP